MRFGLLLSVPQCDLHCRTGWWWVLCNRMYHISFGTSLDRRVQGWRLTAWSTGPNCALSFYPLRPLFITHDVAVRLRTNKATEWHTDKGTQTFIVDLTGSERVVNRAGGPSLPGEPWPAQADIVHGVPDAELRQQQQPARPLHLRLAVLFRPLAGWGGSST